MTFQNDPADDFDLVIGADGLHSNARRLVSGPEEQFEHYLGCKVAACVVDGYRPSTGTATSDAYLTDSIPGRQIGQFTLRGNRTMFLFVFRDEHDCHGMTPKERLHNQFDDDGWECPEILAAVDAIDDLFFDVVSQIRMDRWSKDRVLLIGDAAGCISLLGGKGTGLAITEATRWPGNSPAPTATTARPSQATRRCCGRSSTASRPAPNGCSGSSPPERGSGCGSATWHCGQ
ncbi:putative oxidoreductase [Mycolicibacterium conceptionense]|uniref:Putative oxidoreductase n=1 Tax=Mycolicibacterium conceptionense TaxID=451644 RepID=A0A0U1D4W5_9MYCO|nr:putative oxidoreductase [Mycolicibacterium conceptionense]